LEVKIWRASATLTPRAASECATSEVRMVER